MKKCPFCAEEIQDEAIKCRYCQSFLSAAPPKPGAKPGDRPAAADRTPAPEPAAESESESAPSVIVSGELGGDSKSPASRDREPRRSESRRDDASERERGRDDSERRRPLSPASRYSSEDEARDRRVLYSGSPSWRAYLGEYASLVAGAIVVPFCAYWLAARLDASGFTRFLTIAIPLAVAALAGWILNLYRRSKLFRVTTTNIETEYGLISKKIDVLELWRCRDVRYRQSLLDRILRIAHIEIFTADVTTPNLCIVGLPASRQLFENIRDSIEIQRQSRNVVGFVQ